MASESPPTPAKKREHEPRLLKELVEEIDVERPQKPGPGVKQNHR
jgi:hypothetical protein